MNEKEKWINETLESIDRIKPADVPSSLNQKIFDHLFVKEARIISIRPRVKWAIAASMALLIALNSLIVLQYNRSIKENRSEAYNLYKNYFDYTEQF